VFESRGDCGVESVDGHGGAGEGEGPEWGYTGVARGAEAEVAWVWDEVGRLMAVLGESWIEE